MSGLLGNVFAGVLPPTVKPEMVGNDIKIRITERDFIDMVMKGVDERYKQNIGVEVKDGYIMITVRLM